MLCVSVFPAIHSWLMREPTWKCFASIHSSFNSSCGDAYVRQISSFLLRSISFKFGLLGLISTTTSACNDSIPRKQRLRWATPQTSTLGSYDGSLHWFIRPGLLYERSYEFTQPGIQTTRSSFHFALFQLLRQIQTFLLIHLFDQIRNFHNRLD